MSELSQLATMLGGLPVLGCLAGSPAGHAGVRYGDILLSIDDKPTRSWDEFLEARRACRGGFKARIFRDGSELEIQIVFRTGQLPSPLEVLSEVSVISGFARPPAD